MAKSEKTKEKVQSPVQIAVLFEGTGLDGDSSSNVARLARVCEPHAGEPRAVHAARHAVAINEYRGHFDYVPMRGKQVTERFFVGYKNHTLVDVAGAWVVRGALRQGLRLKEGAKLSEALAPDPVIHNSLGDATNFWGALGGIRRKIDSKRLHRSVKKILSRILDRDGNPVPPETFKDAPTV